MYRHSGVSHDGFGSRGSDFDVAHASGLRPTRKRDARATFLHNLIPNKIQISILRFANYLFVGNGSLRRGIPIDHPATAVDQTFVVKLDKDFLNSCGISIIERIALTGPIA